MSLRHKKVQTVLGKGLSSEWNDDHVVNFATRINWDERWMINALTDNWELGQETSTTPTVVLFWNDYVAASLYAAGGVGNRSTIRRKLLNVAADFTGESMQPVLEMAIGIFSPTADNATHEFGFFVTATTPFTANQNGAFFRIDNNVLWAVSSNGAAETKTNLGAPSLYAVYMIKHTAAGDFFYIDDLEAAAATHLTTLSVADLTIKLTCAQRAAGVNEMDCQAIWFSGLRQTA